MEPNVELRAARLALPSPRLAGEPMSRTELADAVNTELWRATGKRYALDGHAIARYERGAVRWPTASYRYALRTVLGVATDAEIGFHPVRRREDAARVVDPITVDWAEPETFRAVTGLAVGAGEPGRPDTDRGSPEDYRSALAGLQAVDREQGPRYALAGVLDLVERIDQDLRVARDADRAALLAVGARAAEFAGFLCRDLGAAVRCLRCHDRAMEWAQQAQDGPMQAYVLLRKAQAAYDERDAGRMLGLARAARTYEPVVAAGLRAEVLQQEARAEAMLGAPDADVLRKLDLARTLVTGGATVPAGDPGGGYSEAMLDLQTALCFTELGRPREAVDWFRLVLDEHTGSARDRGYFEVLLATALALSGEPDEAVAIGLTALPVVVRSTSRRSLREARSLSTALRPWARRSSVRELYDRLGAADRAVSAG
jgi:hypothetical protein